jgi:hypothetical protein
VKPFLKYWFYWASLLRLCFDILGLVMIGREIAVFHWDEHWCFSLGLITLPIGSTTSSSSVIQSNTKSLASHMDS